MLKFKQFLDSVEEKYLLGLGRKTWQLIIIPLNVRRRLFKGEYRSSWINDTRALGEGGYVQTYQLEANTILNAHFGKDVLES